MKIAKYGKDYWDGNRSYGYGGLNDKGKINTNRKKIIII